MLFNSYAYIFLFLPLVLVVYFALNRKRLTLASKIFLFLASLFFYGWWNPIFVPLIMGSIVFNYSMGRSIAGMRERNRLSLARYLLWGGVSGNLTLLGYFKYTDFLISNINGLGLSLPLQLVALPLGISFFTFTQIAYLLDAEKGKVKEYGAINYGLFVTFFPHLLAGPIIHHSEMMPQFDRPRNKVSDPENLSRGLILFFIGLFKKAVIADSFAIWANNGFNNPGDPTIIQAWTMSFAYTLQLYYDFSGYTDMALGSARMFNIILPINFDSPYRSLSIQEFWRRWHITLGRFMRDYVYVPLGGGRVSESHAVINILLTFFLVGLWHGAGWTFVVWGSMHGTALVIYRFWRKWNVSMPDWLAWLLTFNFVNIGWVFFRAASFEDAFRVLKGMAGLNGSGLYWDLGGRLFGYAWPRILFEKIFAGLGNGRTFLFMVCVFFPLAFLFRNSNEMVKAFEPNRVHLALFSCVAALSVLYLSPYSEFLYFRF